MTEGGQARGAWARGHGWRRALAAAVLLGIAAISPLTARPSAGDPASEAPSLRVALTGKYPPFSFYDREGELTGFDVDVAHAVARHLDRELEIVTTEWDGILVGLLMGSYDTIIGSMAVTPERASRVAFSEPYYVSGAQVFVSAADAERIAGIGDLAGRRIGVGIGETYEHYLRSEHPEVEVVTYRAQSDIFQDMLNGRLDAFLTDRLVGLYQVETGDMPFVPVGPLLYEEKIAIPVRPDRPKLLADIDAALADMKSEGELDRLKQKWFGEEVATSAAARGISATAVARKLGRGFAVTLFVGGVSIALGLLLAIPFGVALHRHGTPLYYVLRSIDDFIRATPLLIQLFFVYFGAPQIGITLTPIQAAILTLTINGAAYMAEVVRSGLLAVPSGQRKAARALGLDRFQTFRHVVWPQAFRVAVPPLMNSIVALTKDTALISVIAVGEVIREAQSIISVTYNPMKYYFIAAAMFFVVTFPLMKLADRLERRLAAKGFLS